MVRRQIDMAALLGVDCILVCPGTVGVDFRPEDVVPDANDVTFFAGSEIIDYDVVYQRSQEALKELAPYAQEKGVIIGIENIWNKFLLSPMEFRTFLDEIGSDYVGAFLDVGNMVLYGYPEHWIKILGHRIKKVHFKDYRRDAKGLAGFVDLLAGDVDWVKVINAFEAVGYRAGPARRCVPHTACIPIRSFTMPRRHGLHSAAVNDLPSAESGQPGSPKEGNSMQNKVFSVKNIGQNLSEAKRNAITSRLFGTSAWTSMKKNLL